MEEINLVMGEELGMCPYCERKVTTRQSYVFDEETGKWFHAACYANWKEDQKWFQQNK